MTPCISLWQPWCNWVALGWKPIETRLHDRFAKLAGRRIGIHAALRYDPSAFAAAAPYLTGEQAALTRTLPKAGGVIVCTALVREARWLTDADSAAALIDCGGTRRFGLVLDDVRLLPASPPVKGRQGLFYVDLGGTP